MGEKPLNCWEYKKCGRQPGGARVAELGVCPAAIERSLDGIHRGDNAGRACWVIAGTYCGGKVQGDYAAKLGNCANCEFFQMVLREEHTDLQDAIHILEALEIVARH
ncbi:MAG: two-CW domain-containing protein [Thermodesulfobacteriota bacterium]